MLPLRPLVRGARASRRAGALTALALAFSGCGTDRAPARSVVLIVVDTLRADHLGAWGYPRPTSAELDRRVAQGVLFERAFAPSSWTLPSFASLYLGLWPSAHGVGRAAGSERRFTSLAPGFRPLAQILAEQGFATVGVANNPFLHPGFGLARGFGDYRYVYGNLAHQPRASQIAWLGLRWLDERDPARRFLLVLHLFDPHLSYDPHPSVRGSFSSGYAGRLALPFGGFGEANAGWAPRDPEDRRFVAAAYDEELLFVDRQLARLFAGLEERGLRDETLVVLTADHGEELFEHGGFEHGHSLHQELLHVPLVLWGPGVEPGRIATPVSLVDVLPTVLDALGLAPVEGLSGVSLWPLATRRAPLPERAIVAEGTLHGPERRALLRWPWKLLEVDGGAPRLYDLGADPAERKDLAAADPERVRALAAELAGLRAASAADAPAPELDDETRRQLSELGYLE
jgi:arylsulfatase A-like enzyme